VRAHGGLVWAQKGMCSREAVLSACLLAPPFHPHSTPHLLSVSFRRGQFAVKPPNY
jgi:hypothetical protein